MSPFKTSAVKGGSSKGKGPVIDVDNLSPRPKRTRSQIGVLVLISSNPMLHFRIMRTILEKLRCWLKGLLSRRLFLKQKSPSGLPPKIGTTYFPTLMMHTRTW